MRKAKVQLPTSESGQTNLMIRLKPVFIMQLLSLLWNILFENVLIIYGSQAVMGANYSYDKFFLFYRNNRFLFYETSNPKFVRLDSKTVLVKLYVILCMI